MNIPDLLNGILAASADEEAAKARKATLRAALEAEARRRFDEEGAAPSWNAPKMGKVRLDPPGDWKAAISETAAFASWVAQNHPTEAVAVVYLEAPHLEEALQALEFAAIKPLDTTVELRPAWLDTFLGGLSVDVEEVPTDDAGTVDRTFTISNPETGDIVPGLTGRRADAKLVVTLDREAKAIAINTARAAAAAILDEPDAEPGDEPLDIAASEANLVDPNAPTPDPLTEVELAQRAEHLTSGWLDPRGRDPLTDELAADLLARPGPDDVDIVARQARELGETIDTLMAENTAEDLKRACRARTLSVAGGKHDLAERLATFAATTHGLTL